MRRRRAAEEGRSSSVNSSSTISARGTSRQRRERARPSCRGGERLPRQLRRRSSSERRTRSMQYPTRTVTRSTPMHWTGCRALRRPSSASASSLIQMFVSPSLPLCFLLEEARLTVLASQWVNDIVLCNYNRTLVSASSDSLVLAWSPHSTNHQDQVTPTPVGRHGDYVRCLATPREGNWVASGGFDRKIKLWDVGEGRSSSVPLRKSRPPLPFELVLMFLSCSRAAKPASVNLLARNERLRIPHRGGHSRARRSYLGSSVVQAGLSTGWSHG